VLFWTAGIVDAHDGKKYREKMSQALALTEDYPK